MVRGVCGSQCVRGAVIALMLAAALLSAGCDDVLRTYVRQGALGVLENTIDSAFDVIADAIGEGFNNLTGN
jgi:deoxyhypusine synthase